MNNMTDEFRFPVKDRLGQRSDNRIFDREKPAA